MSKILQFSTHKVASRISIVSSASCTKLHLLEVTGLGKTRFTDREWWEWATRPGPANSPRTRHFKITNFNLNLSSGIEDMDFANALMGEKRLLYLAEPLTPVYCRDVKLLTLRGQFVLFVHKMYFSSSPLYQYKMMSCTSNWWQHLSTACIFHQTRAGSTLPSVPYSRF